jgi:hypothetical protein
MYLACLQGMVENRRCRDVLFLLLFIAYWVGMFIVCGIAFQSGEASLLTLALEHHLHAAQVPIDMSQTS